MKWPEFSLSKLTRQFISGGTPSTKKQEYWNGDIPWITGADFSDGEVVLGRRFINKDAVNNSATHIVPAGSILMVTRTGVGKIAIAPFDIAISQDITGIIPRQGVVNSEFLVSAIKQRMGTILAAQRGATIKGVTRDDINQLPIPLPAPSEQQRIVEMLDQADALRKKRAEANAKAARILPTLFYKMFGDPAANLKEWKVVELNDVIADTRNGLYKPSKFYGSGIGILKMFNIKDGELNLSRIDLIEVTNKEFEAYQLIPGDILINRVNTPELVGKCAIITDEVGKAVFESKNIRIRVKSDRVTPEYVATYINSPFGHAALRSGVKHAIGMATINNTDLRKTPIPFPPMELQRKWADTVIHVRSLRAAAVATGENFDSLFQNLLFQAFSGDLTAMWRKAHRKEILSEMTQQAKYLEISNEGQT